MHEFVVDRISPQRQSQTPLPCQWKAQKSRSGVWDEEIALRSWKCKPSTGTARHVPYNDEEIPVDACHGGGRYQNVMEVRWHSCSFGIRGESWWGLKPVSEMNPKAHCHGTMGELDPRPTDDNLPRVTERVGCKTVEVLAVNGHTILESEKCRVEIVTAVLLASDFVCQKRDLMPRRV
jgi:hypothetical protein